jgi:hypothetical protein
MRNKKENFNTTYSFESFSFTGRQQSRSLASLGVPSSCSFLVDSSSSRDLSELAGAAAAVKVRTIHGHIANEVESSMFVSHAHAAVVGVALEPPPAAPLVEAAPSAGPAGKARQLRKTRQGKSAGKPAGTPAGKAPKTKLAADISAADTPKLTGKGKAAAAYLSGLSAQQPTHTQGATSKGRLVEAAALGQRLQERAQFHEETIAAEARAASICLVSLMEADKDKPTAGPAAKKPIHRGSSGGGRASSGGGNGLSC